MSELLWQPDEQRKQDSHLFAFMTQVSSQTGLNLYHYHDLYDWSISHLSEFWNAFALFALPSLHQDNMDGVIHHVDSSFIHTRFFPDALINYAEHLLRDPDDSLAVLAFDESGEQARLTRHDLMQRVAEAQAWLCHIGVKKNDVVAGLLPNIPEALIFMLATTAMGAVWTSCSPDFGVPAIIDRFSQVNPRALIIAPGYRHKGRWIDCSDKNQALVNSLKTVYQVHSVDRRLDETEKSVVFESLAFDHPAFILYSSGTTGMPKCIVHGHGGTLIQHMKELMLHTDLKKGDRLLYLTTCGWMMWNWMASALAVGACVVLYEGNPLFPEADSLLSVLSSAKINIFGTSAKFLSIWQKSGVSTHDNRAFESIRTVLSTGSPLMPDTFKYVYKALKTDLCLSSISGGTDIISCFALGCPMLPVYAGELQCRGLGMAVEVWNEAGEPVVETQGELVCVKPFPSKPLKFWNDPDERKYRKAYFSHFESVWTHGDYATLKANGGLVIFGRSDAVLNPGGVRIGTAEIYRQVETLPAISESLAVGLDRNGSQDIVLFIILAPGHELTTALTEEIRHKLRDNASPRHVPTHIIAIRDFPRTVNGKVSEIAVTKILNHQPLDNIHALANPEVLDLFRELRL